MLIATMIMKEQQFSKLKSIVGDEPLVTSFDKSKKRRRRRRRRRIERASTVGKQCLCLVALSLVAISICYIQVIAAAQLDKRDYMTDPTQTATATATATITRTSNNSQITPPIEKIDDTIKTTKAVQQAAVADDKVSRLRPDGDDTGSLATTAATTIGQGDFSVTTLLIDYDQQGYTLSSQSSTLQPATKSLISSIDVDKEITVAVTSSTVERVSSVIPAESLASSTRATIDDEEIRKGRSTADADERETILVDGNTDEPQAAKLVMRADPADIAESKLPIVNLPRDFREQAEEEPHRARQLNQLRANHQQPAHGGVTRHPTDVYVTPKRPLNETNIHELLLRKKPYSKYWTIEQKWDDIFKRLLSVQDAIKNMLIRSLVREVENYADVSLSQECSNDLRYIQEYQKRSTNFRWLTHMADAVGKNEPGLLTGNMADLGHVIQCIKVRAPGRPSNDSFDERFFDLQTETLGEKFRGKYCLASIRPILPERPKLISRFNELMDTSLLSNISYFGQDIEILKRRIHQLEVPKSTQIKIDRNRYRLDQVPFESEFFQYLIDQRNFMYSLPRYLGMCYPSSCTKDDVRRSFQKLVEDHHQVVDIEFECEQEEVKASSWFTFSRLVVYVFLFALGSIIFGASLSRHILVDRLGFKKSAGGKNASMDAVLNTLELLSLDKSAGILFVKTKKASPLVDKTKLENNRSTSIDALRGFLILMLIYSQLVYLGCLPVPFMWSKWGAAMFPFYRSYLTQIFLNISIWTEAFYMISAYLIGAKLLENNRPTLYQQDNLRRQPDFATYALKRYIRLVLPMVGFISLNYVWPRLSNGFVMQDQAAKLMRPCDNHGWTNMLLFHNHNSMNETCLWPSHVSASFFQLHLISYPILLLLLSSLRTRDDSFGARKYLHILTTYSGLILLSILAIIGIVYPALKAVDKELIVPFLIDYIDFDNYRRVIEWTVTPTYNHITSYMIGLALSYLVVKRRADREGERKGSLSDSQCDYLHKGNSLDSMASSNNRDYDPYTMKQQTFPDPIRVNKLKHLEANSSADADNTSASVGIIRRVITTLDSVFVCMILLLSITSSWIWNGLGQPMSPSQTFWYMCITKLVFALSFAYLFYKHFATRKNATNPWMITRFLVPIGRMSLTLFYLSWLVIWFDLLSSLYQWHPSHYFVFEKFSEIIFMVLVLGMIVYACFEGTVKIVSYRNQADQLARKQQKLGSSSIESHGFDSLFLPTPEDDCQVDKSDSETLGKSTIESSPVSKVSNNKMLEKSSMVQYLTGVDGKPVPNRGVSSQQLSSSGDRSRSLDATKGRGNTRPDGGDDRNLSIADQYKLNAELRANYSFASIGLYEKAGVSDCLTPDPSDPQMSPSSASDIPR